MTVSTAPSTTNGDYPLAVSVAVDTRIGRRPWMDASCTGSGLQLTDTEGSSHRTFEIYQKPFPAGQLALGPEADTANHGSMYVVILS